MDESARLVRLAELAVLDTPPEPLFDSLTRIAATQCTVPVALIGLIDAERQWYKSRVGFDTVSSLPRDLSFCALALNHAPSDGLIEVHDAREDPRFSAHPMVQGPPHIRFYAGVLLVMPGGEKVGTLCILDSQPRWLSEAQRTLLRELAAAAVQGLLLREQALKVALAVKSRHEDELNHRAEALNSVLDELPAAVAAWDRELNNVFANRQHDAWYGPAQRDGRPRNLAELLPPEAMARVLPLHEACQQGDRSSRLTMWTAPGRTYHRRILVRPRIGSDGRIDGHLALITDETAAHELAIVQATLAAMVRESDDAIFTFDAEGFVTSWNPGAERLLGYTAEEMVGKQSLELVVESERAASFARRLSAAAGVRHPVFEGLRLHKLGHAVPVSVNGFALPPVHGSATRFCVVARDLSPRKAAEARLRESEQSYRALAEASPVGVYRTDAVGACTYTNAAWQQIYGIGLADSLGTGWARSLHPEDRGAVYERWLGTADGAEPFDMVFRILRDDGSERHVHSRANAVKDAAGAVVGFVGVVQDITRRVAAEAALEASRELLRQLYEATPALLYSSDGRGHILSVSDAWLDKLGFTRDEVIGRLQDDFIAEPSRRLLAETAWPKLVAEGRVDDVPLRLLPRHGEEIYVVMAARFNPSSAGDATRRVLTVMQDVTTTLRRGSELQRERLLRAEVEQRAEELAALLRERSEMLDVLAHEVRQPLNNASAALQSAQATLGGDAAGVGMRLERAAQVLAAVRGGIDNTLAAAALLASDEPLAVEDADVDLLVALTLGDLDPAERQRVQVQREGVTRTAAMDVSLMRLALRNLLVNALRCSPPNSPVTLAINDSDEPLALFIEVRDGGGGFAPAFVPRMFQRGARGPAAAGRRVAGGTGLGLYIVHRILHMHGGRVQLAHNAPGDVCMRLVLPPAHDE